jgi:hypothetical protein
MTIGSVFFFGTRTFVYRKERRIIIRIRLTVPEMRPAIGWPEKPFLGQ